MITANKYEIPIEIIDALKQIYQNENRFLNEYKKMKIQIQILKSNCLKQRPEKANEINDLIEEYQFQFWIDFMSIFSYLLEDSKNLRDFKRMVRKHRVNFKILNKLLKEI